MNKSYTIKDSIALAEGPYYFDLHNEYELEQYVYNKEHGSAELVFDAVVKNKDRVEIIRVIFTGISHFFVSPGFESKHAIVDGIGYKSHDDDTYDSLIEEEKSNISDHLVFRFVSGDVIRILAQSSEIL